MSDLIRRSELLKDIKDWQEDIHYNEKDAIQHDFVFDRIYEMLYEQPTAYDIDKVVRQLNLESVGSSIQMSLGLLKAIEIVKQGGIGKDVE